MKVMKARHALYLALALAAGLAAAAVSAAPARGTLANAFAPPDAAELGLSGITAREWDALRDETVALRRVSREQIRDGMAELRTMLDQPEPDLRGFSVIAQRQVDAHLAEARALRERQLVLYESLPPAGQARVRAAMAGRLDRLARLRERFDGFTDVGL